MCYTHAGPLTRSSIYSFGRVVDYSRIFTEVGAASELSRIGIGRVTILGGDDARCVIENSGGRTKITLNPEQCNATAAITRLRHDFWGDGRPWV